MARGNQSAEILVTHCVKHLHCERPGADGSCSERIRSAITVQIGVSAVVAEPVVGNVAAIVARDDSRLACEESKPIGAGIQAYSRGRKINPAWSLPRCDVDLTALGNLCARDPGVISIENDFDSLRSRGGASLPVELPGDARQLSELNRAAQMRSP